MNHELLEVLLSVLKSIMYSSWKKSSSIKPRRFNIRLFSLISLLLLTSTRYLLCVISKCWKTHFSLRGHSMSITKFIKSIIFIWICRMYLEYEFYLLSILKIFKLCKLLHRSIFFVALCHFLFLVSSASVRRYSTLLIGSIFNLS